MQIKQIIPIIRKLGITKAIQVDFKALTAAANGLAAKVDTDVLLYNGPIERPFDDALLDLCANRARRKNIFFLLCTRGGDPDAAYRIARGLQNFYEKVTVAICGPCKSAGTLIAVGAHELVMTLQAEIGPLDMQLGKKDELFEMDSGLTVLNALDELQEKAFELFETGFLRLKIKSGGRITLKTATALASELTTGMMAPIMQQIDPIHVGEVSRAMKIGKEYGQRLIKYSKNVSETALNKLVDDYPSHGFVIDKNEAEDLFENLRAPNDDEYKIIDILDSAVSSPVGSNGNPITFFISEPIQESGDADAGHNEENRGEANPEAGEATGTA